MPRVNYSHAEKYSAIIKYTMMEWKQIVFPTCVKFGHIKCVKFANISNISDAAA